jgi:methylglyoxal synthase
MQATLEGLQNITRLKNLTMLCMGNSHTQWVSSNFRAYALGTTIFQIRKGYEVHMKTIKLGPMGGGMGARVLVRSQGKWTKADA